MTPRNESEVNERAGRLANGVAELLTESEGITNAVVWVVDGAASKWPLAVRNTQNDGFWGTGLDNYRQFQVLAKQARLQADYALTAPGRSAQKQAQKLVDTARNATSYSYDFSQSLQPGYVVDERSRLTVVAVAPQVETSRLVEMTQEAVADVEGGRMPNMMEAGKWLHACYALLQPRLKAISPEASAMAMIALPNFLSKFADAFDPGPVIVAAQSVGAGVDVAKFSIVGAKAMCVARTGKPSGTLRAGLEKDSNSNIMGGIPATFGRYGDRVVALGGLDMKDDVALLHELAASDVGTALGMTLLSEFAR